MTQEDQPDSPNGIVSDAFGSLSLSFKDEESSNGLSHKGLRREKTADSTKSQKPTVPARRTISQQKPMAFGSSTDTPKSLVQVEVSPYVCNISKAIPDSYSKRGLLLSHRI